MESVDRETHSLIWSLAHADVIIDDETTMAECIFCENEQPDSPVFAHNEECPVLRAQAWMRAHAVEGVPVIVVDALPLIGVEA